MNLIRGKKPGGLMIADPEAMMEKVSVQSPDEAGTDDVGTSGSDDVPISRDRACEEFL